MDEYSSRKIRDCQVCDNGRYKPKETCDWCGGSGKRRKCLRADCAEYGCGGYGSCTVTEVESQRSAPNPL
jgi:hypothetical protein